MKDALVMRVHRGRIYLIHHLRSKIWYATHCKRFAGELAVAKGAYRAYRLWMGDETDDNVLSRGPTRQTSNVLENLVSTIFGVGGLFTLRDEEPVHLMAMLTSIGK